MNIELKEFQDDAVVDLLKRVRQAKREAREGDAQAVILSSPTGSGKTVIITKLLEEILGGTDEMPPEPDAVFLWVSDQPELNEQSRNKIAAIGSHFRPHELVIVGTDFDAPVFEGGRVYFLNIQKLGKEKSLVTKGDKRQYTIWETITNTEATLADRFYVIIDEAHRGMNRTSTDERQATTIIQKFVLGELGVLDPVKLIIGISATPERFKRLLENTPRTARPLNIDPEDVRLSGLLKDKIILFHPQENKPSDWTLLAAAAKRWVQVRDAWDQYTKQEELSPVQPALVIQVEDGNDKLVTRTDLEQVIEVLEREIGGIQDAELAHAFQDEKHIEVGRRKIRKIDPSAIQDDRGLKIILFKMALTTGWDCPRAEVMMSFRKAHDHTFIAQLVGRMVRTPLARRVIGYELLNSVSLYLPHFDEVGLSRVIERLKGDPDTVPPIDVEEGDKQAILQRKGGMDQAFNALAAVPTYRVETIRRQSNTRRLMKLARLLTSIHGIDAEALEAAKSLVIATLKREIERVRGSDPNFDKTVSGSGEIVVRAVTIEQGTWKEQSVTPERIALSDLNIDNLFHRAGQRLGEGLELEYWQRNADLLDPNRPKLELFLVLQDQRAWNSLEAACGNRINELFAKHKAAISGRKTSEKEQYDKIREVAKEPEPLDFQPPLEISVRAPRQDSVLYYKHLYVDSSGRFWANFNSWEHACIAAEIKRDDVVAWVRNFERKPWSLAVPYEDGKRTVPTFPDFLVVRDDRGRLRVDIIEPHRPDLDDAWKKARGLARYVRRHAMELGRVEIVRKNSTGLDRLDLSDPVIQEKILQWVSSNAHLNQLFVESGKPK
jgi:type III restriction enzyme